MSNKSLVIEDSDLEDTEAEHRAEATDRTDGHDSRLRSVGTGISRGRKVGESAVKLKTVVASIGVVVVVGVVGVLGWQLHSKMADLNSLRGSAANESHAEQVALDYATGAAQMDFHDLASWRSRLTKATSPELSNRLTQAATSMEQIVTPLQWVSTAKPIAAKVLSDSNGIYSIDCFVSVLTKNSQAVDGIDSTATYQLTIDSHDNWTITNIGGIDSALGPASATPPAVPAGK